MFLTTRRLGLTRAHVRAMTRRRSIPVPSGTRFAPDTRVRIYNLIKPKRGINCYYGRTVLIYARVRDTTTPLIVARFQPTVVIVERTGRALTTTPAVTLRHGTE